MPPLSSTLVALQGLFGLLNGAASLLFPSFAQKNLETLQITSLAAIQSIALASVTIGAFYINAAVRNDRLAMWMMVVGRVMAVPVFWGHGGPWTNVAVFEGLCGVLTLAALVWETWGGSRERRGKGKGKRE